MVHFDLCICFSQCVCVCVSVGVCVCGCLWVCVTHSLSLPPSLSLVFLSSIHPFPTPLPDMCRDFQLMVPCVVNVACFAPQYTFSRHFQDFLYSAGFGNVSCQLSLARHCPFSAFFPSFVCLLVCLSSHRTENKNSNGHFLLLLCCFVLLLPLSLLSLSPLPLSLSSSRAHDRSVCRACGAGSTMRPVSSRDLQQKQQQQQQQQQQWQCSTTTTATATATTTSSAVASGCFCRRRVFRAAV